MDTDRAAEWRRLKERYQDMSNEELASVAAEAFELTEVARQALAAEVSSRQVNIVFKEAADSPQDEDPQGDAQFDPADLDLVILRRVWDAAEARKTKAVLDEAGIPSYLGDQNAEKVDDYQAAFDGGVDVKVREADRQRAHYVVATAWPDAPNHESDADYVAPKCPKCHSAEIVFEGRDAEPAGDVNFDAKYQWSCDDCGHQWEDDGVLP